MVSIPSWMGRYVNRFRDGQWNLAEKLVDDFGVGGGEGDGVVAGVEHGGDIPDQGRSVGVAEEGEEEVGAGGGCCGQGGFAGAVEFGVSDVVTVEAFHDGGAVLGAAGGGEGLHG